MERLQTTSYYCNEVRSTVKKLRKYSACAFTIIVVTLALFHLQPLVLILKIQFIALCKMVRNARARADEVKFLSRSLRCLKRLFRVAKKPVERRDQLVTHHAWDRHNTLLRHSKSFPLLLYIRLYDPRQKPCLYYIDFTAYNRAAKDYDRARKSIAECSKSVNLGDDCSSRTSDHETSSTGSDDEPANTENDDEPPSTNSDDAEPPNANSDDAEPPNATPTDDDQVIFEFSDIALPSEEIGVCPDDAKGDNEFSDAVAPVPDGNVHRGVDRNGWVYVVPRYPDNHNPLLPIALQKQLDEMSPREYLTYVLKDLTLEERESLMVDEKQRRKTFLVNWPHENNLSGVKLAQAGFYSIDDYDRVQCVFCRGSLHKWELDDNPMTEHARSFNFCRFVKGLECGNREYRSDILSADDLQNVHFFKQPELKKNRDGSISADSSTLGISTNKADMIHYAPEPTRYKTFSRWAASNPITSKRLCDAGFYFTGFDDQVRCFYCSGGLREWKPSDDPWEEHARWFPECSFLIQQKGEGYVNQVHDKTAPNKKCSRATVSQKKQAQEKKIQQTLHEAMVEYCLKLGHSLQTIHTSVKINKGPFMSIRDLIDMVYEVEEGERTLEVNETVQTINDQSGNASLPQKRVGIPEEDLNRVAMEMDAVDSASRPGIMDGAGGYPAVEGACILCYRKTGQTTDAHYIGLPCGHMILCEKCNQEEIKKSAGSAYKPKCLYRNCSASLTGTFKTFYA